MNESESYPKRRRRCAATPAGLPRWGPGLCRRTPKLDSAKMNDSNSKCPRCGEGRLLGWRVLSEEEREVVRRLPASADYSLDERKATHRWCTRCWY